MNDSAPWVAAAGMEDIPLREGRVVEIAGREIALFNLGDRFAALENRCPHRGGPLADGIVSGSVVVCPLHAWRIRFEDGAVAKPREISACVVAYPSRIENGIVFVLVQPTSEAEPLECAGADLPATRGLALKNLAG